MASRVLLAAAVAMASASGQQAWPQVNQCSVQGVASWATQCPALTATNVPVVVTLGGTGALASTNLSSLDTVDQARAVLQGQAAVQTMQGLRSQSSDWYNASLTNMMIVFCKTTSSQADLARCVANTSTHAARDRNNKCIVVAGDGACGDTPGMCERQANCMWPSPVPNQPRVPRYTEAQIKDAMTWVSTTYATSLMPYAAPGATIGVLTFLSFLLFFVLRCFCNKCGGRNPVERGYSWCAVLIPGISFFLISFAIFICCIVAYVGNNTVMSKMVQLFAALTEVLNNAQIYANNLLAPINALQATQATTVATVQAATNNTVWILQDATTLQMLGAAIDATYTSAFPKTCVAGGTVCLTCPSELCGQASSAPRTVTTSIRATAAQLDATFKLARDTFYTGPTTLYQAVTEAEADLNVLAAATNNSNAAVATVSTSFDNISYGRNGLCLAIFILGLIVSILGMLGFLCGVCRDKSKWVHLLHVSWVLGVLLCFISFIVASLLMAVSALWFDGCNYLDMIVNNMYPYFSTETSTILTSCIKGTSTMEALAMAPAFTSSCGLHERLLLAQNVAAATLFQQLQTIPLMSYELADFGYSAEKQAELLAKAAVNMPGASDVTTTDNLNTPWVFYTTTVDANCSATTDPAGCFMEQKCGHLQSACYIGFQDARTYASAAASIEATLLMLHEDFQGNANAPHSANWPGGSSSLLGFAQKYTTKLGQFLSTQLPPLTKLDVWTHVNTIQCTSSNGCGWINQEYALVHNLLCQDLLGACLNIALCVFLVALFLIPLAICGIILQKRLRGIRGGAYGEMEPPEAPAEGVQLTPKQKLQAKLDALTKGKIPA